MAPVMQSGSVFFHQFHIGHGKVFFSFIFSWKQHGKVRKGMTCAPPSYSILPPKEAAQTSFAWILTFQG